MFDKINSRIPGAQAPMPDEKCDTLNIGYELLKLGNFSTTYTMFKALIGKEKSPSFLFNLTLCYMEAKDYGSALNSINEAQSAIKSLIKLTAGPTADNIEQTLLKNERRNNIYSQPMMPEFPELFPELSAEYISCLKIDIMLHLEMWSQIVEQGSVLESKGCENVISAMQTAKNKLTTNK